MAEVGKRALLAGSWMEAENKIYFPSGVNVEGISPVEWVVSRWAVPPSAGITNTSKLPYLSLAKAICLPSGDHMGVDVYKRQQLTFPESIGSLWVP